MVTSALVSGNPALVSCLFNQCNLLDRILAAVSEDPASELPQQRLQQQPQSTATGVGQDTAASPEAASPDVSVPAAGSNPDTCEERPPGMPSVPESDDIAAMAVELCQAKLSDPPASSGEETSTTTAGVATKEPSRSGNPEASSSSASDPVALPSESSSSSSSSTTECEAAPQPGRTADRVTTSSRRSAGWFRKGYFGHITSISNKVIQAEEHQPLVRDFTVASVFQRRNS